jgi:electron transfer flavoprotein alpha subunit
MHGLGDNIWVVAQQAEGIVQPVTYEVLALARRAAELLARDISVLVSGHPVRPLADEIAEKTGLEVIGADARAAGSGSVEAYRHVLRGLALPHPPPFLFLPHTPMGWELAPGLAVDLGASSLSAVHAIEADPDLVFLRRMLNGKLVQEVRPIQGRPTVVTVVPGAEPPCLSSAKRPGHVRIIEGEEIATKTEVIGYKEPPAGSVLLRDAEVVVAAGRGVGGAEHLACIRELAALFQRSAVGASRPLCDAGVLPLSCQVGMTGQTVSPKVYIACGISGAVQHTMGMKRAGLVIVINSDPNALFCREAHYCVAADLHAFIPLLIEKIRQIRGKPRG